MLEDRGDPLFDVPTLGGVDLGRVAVLDRPQPELADSPAVGGDRVGADVVGAHRTDERRQLLAEVTGV